MEEKAGVQQPETEEPSPQQKAEESRMGARPGPREEHSSANTFIPSQ